MSAANTATSAPSTRRHNHTWRVPLALVALSLIPVIAGSLRLSDPSTETTFMPQNAHHPPAPIALIVHIVSAVGYSLLGAFQFSAGIRRRHPGWHRRAGRVLVPLGLAVAASAVWLTLAYPPEENSGAVLYWSRLLFGVAMGGCLVGGLLSIRGRDIGAHRAWMIRAYAIGLGAGTQVVTIGLGQAAFGTGTLATDFVTAAGWVVNVTVAEVLIRVSLAHRARQGDRAAVR